MVVSFPFIDVELETLISGIAKHATNYQAKEAWFGVDVLLLHWEDTKHSSDPPQIEEAPNWAKLLDQTKHSGGPSKPRPNVEDIYIYINPGLLYHLQCVACCVHELGGWGVVWQCE
jgi:hypothetical protein